MRTIRFIIGALRMVPAYFSAHPVNAVIITLVFLGLSISLFGGKVRNQHDKGGFPETVHAFLRFLVCIGLILAAICLNVSSEVAALEPELLDGLFYLELIVCSVLTIVLDCRSIMAETDQDALAEAGDELFHALVVTILSVIFWIFGTGLINWGFSIFHKKLGGWVFGIYAGWAVEIVFGLAAILIGKTADLLTGAVNGIRPGRDKERKPVRSRKGGTDIGFIMKNLVLPLTVGIIFLGAVIWLTTRIG